METARKDHGEGEGCMSSQFLPVSFVFLFLAVSLSACKSRTFHKDSSPKGSQGKQSSFGGTSSPALAKWATMDWFTDAQGTSGEFRLKAEQECIVLGGTSDSEELPDVALALKDNLTKAANVSTALWEAARNVQFVEKDNNGGERLSSSHPDFDAMAARRISHYFTIAQSPLAASKRRELCADLTARVDAAEKAILDARAKSALSGEDRMKFLMRVQNTLQPPLGQQAEPFAKLTFQELREVSVWSRESYASRQLLAWLLDPALVQQELDFRKQLTSQFKENQKKWEESQAKARAEYEEAQKARAGASGGASQKCVAVITLQGQPLIWTRSFIDRSGVNTPLIERLRWPLTTVVASGNDRSATLRACEERKRERQNMHEEYGYECSVQCD